MDNLSTFLELPLDRDLYKPKAIAKRLKPPLRVLVTEAGSKTAQLLMYRICTGEVFGPDQPVILHLHNAKGCINHKSTLLDLEECGFSAFADSVISADPEKIYGKVDVVILIALFEKLSGHSAPNSFLCQLTKTRNVARYTRLYSKPNAKLVVCSPSTKGVVILLTCIRLFEPQLNLKNMTGVVTLDETIAKHLIAARLRTTTDKIKNVTIWGGTSADLHNATVFIYPPDDKASLEEKEIPVLQLLENQEWIYSDFIPSIYKRVLTPGFGRHGGAVASAVATHLKFLFQGSDTTDEIVSMAVIVPPSEPYCFSKNIGFSLPVVTKNGHVTVREGIDCDVATHLISLRAQYNLLHDPSMRAVYNLVKYIMDFEETSKTEFLWNQHTFLTIKSLYSLHFLKYIVSPSYEAATAKEATKKSIAWEEVTLIQRDSKRSKSALQLKF